MLRPEHRRWKKAAEQAIAVDRLHGERERLAAEVARRVLRVKSDREIVDARDETTLLALEVAVLPLLDDALIRTSLGLRYLDALEHSLRAGDYEDQPRLRAEASWVEAYLTRKLQFGLTNPGAGASGYTSPQAQESRAERLSIEVIRRVSAELELGVFAAA